MPRQARLDAPGTVHHVILRGLERRAIVKDDVDREAFVTRLGAMAQATGTPIYGWALLPNMVEFMKALTGSQFSSPKGGVAPPQPEVRSEASGQPREEARAGGALSFRSPGGGLAGQWRGPGRPCVCPGDPEGDSSRARGGRVSQPTVAMEVLAMKEINEFRTWLLILLGLGLSACAAGGTLRLPVATPTPYPPPGYVHRVATSDVELYYNCSTPSPGGMHLDGLAFNPWSSQPVRALEFELVGVDSRGWSVSEATAEARDYQLFTNQSTPFDLDLKTVGSEVRFDMYFAYQFSEGEFQEGQFQEGDHDNIEISKVAWQGPMALALQPNRSLVRDACSPGLHLAR
jgi:hypothetical protein